MESKLNNNKLIFTGKNNEFFLTEEGLEIVREEILIKKNSYAATNRNFFNIDEDTFRKLCKKSDINVDNRRKYSLNENYFENIDTKEKAYWLGFLCADGSISETRGRVDITLQPQDISHLSKFLYAIQSNHPIKKGKSNNRTFDNVYIHINSRKMVNDLVDKGCYQNKSLTLSPPTFDKVPEKYIKYWILGYYDGDGCICIYNSNNSVRYKVLFTGTYEVLSFINDIFGFNSSIRKEHRCENTYQIAYTEGKAKKFLDSVYDNDTIKFCLTRKYEKYCKIA